MSRALGKRFHRITRGEDPDFDHWLAYVDEAASQARNGPREDDPGQGKD